MSRTIKKLRSEKTIQNEIIKYLKSLGKRCWFQKNMKTNRNGIPDITGCIDGMFFGIEIKKEAGDFRDVSKLQRLELSDINNAGGFAFFCNDENYAIQMLERYVLL